MRVFYQVMERVFTIPTIVGPIAVQYQECGIDGLNKAFDSEEDAVAAIETHGYYGELYTIVKQYAK